MPQEALRQTRGVKAASKALVSLQTSCAHAPARVPVPAPEERQAGARDVERRLAGPHRPACPAQPASFEARVLRGGVSLRTGAAPAGGRSALSAHSAAAPAARATPRTCASAISTEEPWTRTHRHRRGRHQRGCSFRCDRHRRTALSPRNVIPIYVPTLRKTVSLLSFSTQYIKKHSYFREV